MKSAIFLACLALLAIATQFQNCSDMSGTGIGGVLDQPSCGVGEECQQNIVGDPDQIDLQITSGALLGASKVQDVGLSSPSFEIAGDCNSGGFKKTAIEWKLSDGTVVVRSGRSGSCGENNQFTTNIDLTGTPALIEKTYKLAVVLVAFDQYDNEFRGNNANLDVRALNIKAAPFFSVRACPAGTPGTGTPWREVKENRYYVYNTSDGSTSVFLGEDVTPALCGYCQFRATLNPVKLSLERVGQTPGATPVVFEPNNNIVQCLNRAGTAIPNPTGTDSATTYNGYFVYPQSLQILDSSPVAGWHTRLVASMEDNLGGTTRVVSSKDRQNIEVHFRFRTGGAMRGWTYPLARSVLKKLSSALTLKNVDDNAGLQARAQTLLSGTSAVGNTSSNTLRRVLVQGVMRHTEAMNPPATGPIMFNANLSTVDGFAQLLFKVAGRTRKCDEAIATANDLPVVPNFLNGGTHTDINSQDAQLDRMAVCLTYWFYQGTLGRNDSNLKQGLERGLVFEPGSPDRCRISGTNNYIGNDVCGFMTYDPGSLNTLNSIVRTAHRRYIPGLLPGGAGQDAVAMGKFYNAVAQKFLNWNVGGLCDSFTTPASTDGYNEFWYRALNGSLVVPLSHAAGLNNTNISALWVSEQNGYVSGEYKTYSENDDCMSQNANGSFDLVTD